MRTLFAFLVILSIAFCGGCVTLCKSFTVAHNNTAITVELK